MKNEKIDYIFFDMDGTIADLYKVENWLEKLRNCDVSPYVEAAPMLNFSIFARTLNRLKKDGYKIGIITWGSKDAKFGYDMRVFDAKKDWLETHLPSVEWNEIILTPYGKDKSAEAEAVAGKKSILFDDNADIRNNYKGYAAYDVNNIMEILKLL